MTHEEALSIKQSIEEALKRYTGITGVAIPTVSIKEEITKKLVVFKSKSYSILIDSKSDRLNLLSEVKSLEDAQNLIQYVTDQTNQLTIQKLLKDVRIAAFGRNSPQVQFDELDKEYQQTQNQRQTNTDEPIVGDTKSVQSVFSGILQDVSSDAKVVLTGNEHANTPIKPSLYLMPESHEAFMQICDWKFDLSDISRVENYIKEIEIETIKALAENNEVDAIISRYLKLRENLLLSQEDVNRIVKVELRILSNFQNTINQAKEILQGIKDENKTDNFKVYTEPYVVACEQAIEIARTRLTTIANMIQNASEYLTSQECKDFLATTILEAGNERQKKYFQVCEQIAENGGSFANINAPSQTFTSGNVLVDSHLTSLEEARLYKGRVVSVYDQTVAGTNFFPVATPVEKEYRDNVYCHYDRGYDSSGNKEEVLERHKKQAMWYNGSDGSTYLWLKGVGFINTETETLLTAEEFENLQARGVKIVLTQGLDYHKEEIARPRMKDGSPYQSVYDFERNLSGVAFFRGEEVIHNRKALYEIVKENGLIPPYFGEQAIKYLDSKFGYYKSQEQESEASAEEFNEFDYNQEVENTLFTTESEKTLKSEEMEEADLEEVKKKIKESLAEKIRKAESLSVKDEDLDIMQEMVSITKIIAKEQGIDIEVEASSIKRNVTAEASYDKKKITFNLLALRRLDGNDIDVTRLRKGDVMNSAYQIIRLLQTMLHEIKHFEQKARIDSVVERGSTCDLETFKEAVENEVILNTVAGRSYYKKAHDNFLSEINADIYGWENCIQFFKEYFAVDRVPSDVLEDRESRLVILKEKKQPSTKTLIQGNGCVSTYLSDYGDRPYNDTGKLVAEEFLQIFEKLVDDIKNPSNDTKYLIEIMRDNCKQIIRKHSNSVSY